MSLCLTVTAPTPEALQAAEVEAAHRLAVCELDRCTVRQLDGRLATLPFGGDPAAPP